MRFPFFSGKKKKKEQGNTEEEEKIDDYSLGSSEHFEWRAQAGSGRVGNADWIRKNGIHYLEGVYSVYRDDILKLGEANRLPITVIVKPSAECQGGIAGATGNGELSYCAGTWASNEFCYGILAHELCNLFTGERVGSGWPTAWWANHRSPFPTMIANQALRKLVPEYYRRWGNYNDPLVVMFQKFYDVYPGMFPKMFQKMRGLGVVLSRFEEPYLSHLVYYFMFYGAGQQKISNYFVAPPMPPINPRTISDIEGRFKLGVI
ncbi:MAG: hypothetical protein ACREBS_07490 [Nitrososphaerales archaeon]